MTRISELGDQILKIQSNLGMENPSYYRPGLAHAEAREVVLLRELPARSELLDLLAWKNGVVETAEMGKLWLKPGFYLLSIQECLLQNKYASQHLDGWSGSWYPLLTNGAGGRLFFDAREISTAVVPIFYFDPESVPESGQIYDSIESMLRTVLCCYERGIFFLTPDGLFTSDFPSETATSRELNPNAHYWRRNDLFRQ